MLIISYVMLDFFFPFTCEQRRKKWFSFSDSLGAQSLITNSQIYLFLKKSFRIFKWDRMEKCTTRFVQSSIYMAYKIFDGFSIWYHLDFRVQMLKVLSREVKKKKSLQPTLMKYFVGEMIRRLRAEWELLNLNILNSVTRKIMWLVTVYKCTQNMKLKSSYIGLFSCG